MQRAIGKVKRMSLDSFSKTGERVLCLPHQCEFLSDTWVQRAKEFLLDTASRSGSGLPSFSIKARFLNTPPHLGYKDNICHCSLSVRGAQIKLLCAPIDTPDIQIECEYAAGLMLAQVVGVNAPGVMTEAVNDVEHWFGQGALQIQGRFAEEKVIAVLARLHDHMARMTVENPDVAHRARSLGIERHLQEVEDQGYTVIERAISPDFADKVRDATLRAVWSHARDQLQWMLYHGVEFERLVQNPPLMTLIDASLGRGAIIASISAIRRGPGPGTIPIHTDYSMVPEPYPDFAMTGVGVWALEDWTVESGPTWIVPGSHREKRGPRPGEGKDRGIPIEMPKGSVVYFTHGVWHWQGDRSEPGERVTIHSHFNRGILRGLEPRKVDVQMMHRNPPRLGEMLGEDDWFDKIDAQGRDQLRAGHMVRLQKFTDAKVAELLDA